MEGPASPTVFGSDRDKVVRALLGQKYDALFPRLEGALRAWPRIPPTEEWFRRQFLPHVDAAKRLMRASEKFLNLLQEVEPLIEEACAKSLVRPEQHTVRAMDSLMALHELASLKRRLKTADEARAAVQALRADMQLWQKRAEMLVRRAPGSKTGDPRKRIRLCAWLGVLLSNEGFQLSTVPTEIWGQLYTLMCEEARIPLGKDHDVGRDLRAGLAYLQEGNKIDPSMIEPARKKKTPTLTARSRSHKNRT